MRRAILVLSTAAFLIAALPGAAAAAPSTNIRDHYVTFSCEVGTPEADGSVFADVSTALGAYLAFELWLAPDDPELGWPTAFGESSDVAIVEGAGSVSMTGAAPATNIDGDDLGSITVSASMVAVGAPELGERSQIGNDHLMETGVFQPYEGAGTLAYGGTTYPLDCEGGVGDIHYVTNDPRSDVFENAGLQVVCEWTAGGTEITAFAITDVFGLFASGSIEGPGLEAFGATEEGTFDLMTIAYVVELDDFEGGPVITGTFEATAELVGEPVTSMIRAQHTQERLVEEAISVDGTFSLSTGEVLPVNDAACDAARFETHLASTPDTGPKPGGRAPSNDAPDGAIAVKVGGSVNVQTGGAAFDAEVAIETCPEVDDAMGHTVWYTFTGTGGEVTVDTAGSGFDTLVAVYTRDGDAFAEVACDDDLEGDPVGVSLQGAVTLDTEAGVTYYVQAGGFVNFDVAQYGRLRLAFT